MEKIKNFRMNVNSLYFEIRKLKDECIIKKGTIVNKEEFKRHKKVIKALLEKIEREI